MFLVLFFLFCITFEALALLVVECLLRQRFEVLHVLDGDAETLADALPELVLAHEEVPDHALLDLLGGLGDVGDEVLDEVVALPVLHQPEPLARLRVGEGLGISVEDVEDLEPLPKQTLNDEERKRLENLGHNGPRDVEETKKRNENEEKKLRK